jgi:phenylalanyl-tRNA synthetase beta chain
MLCSEKELSLSEDHTGIMILDSKIKVGQSLAQVLDLPEIIFDIDILPNRAHDCLSIIGVAREVAAIHNS